MSVRITFLAPLVRPIFLPKPGEGGSAYATAGIAVFFFSLNGQRNTTPIFGGPGDPQSVPVPTAEIRVGDFSQFLRPGMFEEMVRGSQ